MADALPGSSSGRSNAVAVYCASSIGTKIVYKKAAISLGTALARADRRLIYGGGARGLMGVVSCAALESGGHVTGVIPYAMVREGGEKESAKAVDGTNSNELADLHSALSSEARARLEVVIVQSMHERKVEMAERVGGFVGLPGGFGTYEEILEVTTWTQLGIHIKPVVLLNVHSFYEPLKQLIRGGISEGFIHGQNSRLITFVDGPADISEHETFDWGKAALCALDSWVDDTERDIKYNWSKDRRNSNEYGST